MYFDFISDEQFRASLTSDHIEMISCADAGSWKAVHVLAGSIIEALLIEYLLVSGIRPKDKDPSILDLSGAIEACKADGVIQNSTASLCDVIRDYRNLIHAGRIIRLQKEVTPEGGQIAVHLVHLITKEVAHRRKLRYGQTGEQITKKIRTDEHCLALLPDLLSETKEQERTKLVMTLIPDAYKNEQAGFTDYGALARLRQAYR
jgi:hypothetical protein